MPAKPFDPGWEIGVQTEEDGAIELRTVARITSFGVIILDDDTEWRNDGLACHDEDTPGPYPRLVPITKEWRRARKAHAVSRLLRDIGWRFVEVDVLLAIYDLLLRSGDLSEADLENKLVEMGAV